MAITDFHLLLFDDNDERRTSLVRAAQSAGLRQVLSLRDEADVRIHLDRLTQGEVPEGPYPSLVLVPLDGPGLNLLSWLNGRPLWRRMVTIGLVHPQEGHLIGRAYDLRVNSCLLRPDGFEEQVEFFRSVRRYWEGLNQSPPP